MAAAQTQKPPLVLPHPLPLQVPSHPAYSSQATLTPPDSDSSSPREQSSSPRSLLNGVPAHLQLQSKQLRTPRSPMYVPAVLRPTEKPNRQSPPKRGGPIAMPDAEDSPQAETDTSSVRRIVTEEWNEARLGEVTGPPSRNHWKPDLSSQACDASTCNQAFTFFQRRHHCRRCGSLFCAAHSLRAVPLDQHARFHPLAPSFRACDDCYRDYCVWEAQRRAKTLEAEVASETAAASATGLKGKAVDIQGLSPQQQVVAKKGIITSIAQSVPRDWSWSTF